MLLDSKNLVMTREVSLSLAITTCMQQNMYTSLSCWVGAAFLGCKDVTMVIPPFSTVSIFLAESWLFSFVDFLLRIHHGNIFSICIFKFSSNQEFFLKKIY